MKMLLKQCEDMQDMVMNMTSRSSPYNSEPDLSLTRSYHELISIPTYLERFRYLKLEGRVGEDTFAFDRHINQMLYQRNPKWKAARDEVIIRDNGCDLGIEGYEIHGKILVHHMNPITLDDILNDRDWIYDPEFLISTTHNTHNAIHYGDERLLTTDPVVRRPNDTCPWRRS